jgi:gp16 family phage-associated protein
VKIKQTITKKPENPDEIRQELASLGISVSDWAREMGFSPGLVHQVLGGRLRCVRGEAHKVAVSLGLKAGKLGGISDLSFSLRTSTSGDEKEGDTD